MKAVIFLGQKREMAFKALEAILEGYRCCKSTDSVLFVQTKKPLSFIQTKQTDKRMYSRKDKNRKKI